MKPDLSGALRGWEASYLIKTVTVTTVDFEETEVVTGRNQQCVVQVADKTKLNPDTINWSLAYLLVHSRKDIAIDELVEYKGADYLVISKEPWSDYGFIKVVAEATNRPVKAVT